MNVFFFTDLPIFDIENYNIYHKKPFVLILDSRINYFSSVIKLIK